MEACLVGSTGLVGSQILAVLAKCSSFSSVHVFTRKDVSNADPKLKSIQNSDSAPWPAKVPANTRVFFSALGTTARQAGGFAAQRKIDYDLNVALAKAAKAAGVEVYTLISTSGACPTSRVPYSKMKGELDEAIKAIGFKHTIIVRPGLLVGTRNDSRPGEFAVRKVARLLGSVSNNRLKDTWAQDADVVAKAAVTAALAVVGGNNNEAVRVLDQADVVRLGRTEWKE